MKQNDEKEYIGSVVQNGQTYYEYINTKTGKMSRELKKPTVISFSTRRTFASSAESASIIIDDLVKAIKDNNQPVIDKKVLQLKTAYDNMIKFLAKEEPNLTQEKFDNLIKETLIAKINDRITEHDGNFQEFCIAVLKVEKVNNMPLFKDALESTAFEEENV
jgi:phosphate uptake regulator